MKKIIVEGMSCGRCTGKIEETLKALNGIEKVTTFLEEKAVYVTGSLDNQTLKNAIESQGYEVVSIDEFETLENAEEKQKKSFFAKLLSKIESSNNKSFGDKRLDCCNLQDKNKK